MLVHEFNMTTVEEVRFIPSQPVMKEQGPPRENIKVKYSIYLRDVCKK